MKNIFTRLIFLGLFFVYLGLLSNRSEGPAGTTGAPDEETCGRTGCHNVMPNQGNATVSIEFNNGMGSYLPSTTNPIKVAIDNPQNATRNGFQIVALDEQNRNAGQWNITGNDKQMRSVNSRDYITHTMTGSNQSSWEMDWVAPNADIGAITFYLAYNDVNANGSTSGDDVYTVSLPVNPSNANAEANVVVDFTNMNPHVGQKLEARLIDKSTLKEVDRISISEIAMPAFNLSLSGKAGESYFVDFYADLNKNGVYDAPPTDHAWRMEIDDIMNGNNMLTFMHNTDFIDIAWKHLLTFDFEGMNPHVGQQLEIRVRDVNQTGREVGRFIMPSIAVPNFSVALPYLDIGRTYFIDFYADLNKNGVYDAPPADHAWREMVTEVSGDTKLTFSHNTNFADIGASGMFTLDFTNMNPHVGQLLEVRLIDAETGDELERFKGMIGVPDFNVELPGLQAGKQYQVDFYADLNKNGLYDAPPMDHAWRETFTAGEGNETLSFTHNTNFIDIDWNYMVTLAATDMTPHLGQKLELKVINTATNSEVGNFSMPAIMVPFFFVRVPGLKLNDDYNVDFYADLNGNGTYDAPPTDHAWRINFDNDEGDELLTFAHNTDFTDIMFTTSVNEISGLRDLQVFPNPFYENLVLQLDLESPSEISIQLINTLGKEVKMLGKQNLQAGQNTLNLEQFNNVEKGFYFLRLQNALGNITTIPIIKN